MEAANRIYELRANAITNNEEQQKREGNQIVWGEGRGDHGKDKSKGARQQGKGMFHWVLRSILGFSGMARR